MNKFEELIEKCLESVFAVDSFPGSNEIVDKDKEEDLIEQTEETPPEKRNILIDFDGPIHKYSKGLHDESIYDPPTEGAKEAIEFLKKYFRIVIFTARISPNGLGEEKAKNNKIEMIEWLKKYDIFYDEITCEKLPAVAYIDDLAINFDNWVKVMNVMNVYIDKIKK